jgi:hypothetical protein
MSAFSHIRGFISALLEASVINQQPNFKAYYLRRNLFRLIRSRDVGDEEILAPI